MRELVDSRLSVRIALMSEAKDPADFVVQRPGEDAELATERRAAFADLLDGADDALATWFRLLRRRLDFGKAADLEAAGRECASLLQLVEGDLRRQALLQEMARHLAVAPQALERLLRKVKPRAPAGAAAPAEQPTPPPRPTPATASEQDLLAALLREPALAARAQGETFESAAVAELVAMVQDAVAAGRTAGAEVVRFLFTRCAERADLRAPLATAAARAQNLGDAGPFLDALQRDLRRHRAGAAARGLRQELQQALQRQDRETADQLTRQLVEQLRQERPRSTSA
jgi:hypothetical protein